MNNKKPPDNQPDNQPDQLLHPLSLKELRQLADQKEREVRARKRWGNWRLRKENWTLVYRPPGDTLDRYEIDLEEMVNPARLLYWIFEAAREACTSPQDQSDLIQALHDIFTPRASFYKQDKGQTFDATRWLEERYRPK